MTNSQFLKHDVYILIHGYNNTYSEALDFFSQIIMECNHLYETFLCYLWPGGDESFEYLEARSRTIEVLSKRLLAVIEDLAKFGKSVDVIAHSMGCRLILETLSIPSELQIRNVFLMAPAVDNESLEEGERYFEGTQRCTAMYIFYSLNDHVLKWAYPLGDFDQALGLGGAENPKHLPKNLFQISCTKNILSHSGYSNSPFVFRVIEEALKKKGD